MTNSDNCSLVHLLTTSYLPLFTVNFQVVCKLGFSQMRSEQTRMRRPLVWVPLLGHNLPPMCQSVSSKWTSWALKSSATTTKFVELTPQRDKGISWKNNPFALGELQSVEVHRDTNNGPSDSRGHIHNRRTEMHESQLTGVWCKSARSVRTLRSIINPASSQKFEAGSWDTQRMK